MEIDLDLSNSQIMKDPRDHQRPTSETALSRRPKVSDTRFISSAVVSPRNHRKNSADFMETASFLRVCGLCNRRLVPGRDIYMYRYLSQGWCFGCVGFNYLMPLKETHFSFVFLWSGFVFFFTLVMLLMGFLCFSILFHLLWWFFDFFFLPYIFMEENGMYKNMIQRWDF